MPRIEIIREIIPIFDFCRECAKVFEEGKPVPTELVDVPEGIVGMVDVKHCPYGECDYTCENCGQLLTSKDD